MLRDVPNISDTFAKEGFDPSICNRVRDVNMYSWTRAALGIFILKMMMLIMLLCSFTYRLCFELIMLTLIMWLSEYMLPCCSYYLINMIHT